MAYSIFKEEIEKDMNSMGIKVKNPKVIYSKRRQTGKRIDLEADKKRKSMPPGKRMSKNGIICEISILIEIEPDVLPGQNRITKTLLIEARDLYEMDR